MSHEVNGITADPLAKVAQVLTSHKERLDDHSRRIEHIEASRDRDERERKNFASVLLLQTVLFVANMVVSYLARR